ncbi:MAG: hypothetical protein LW808_000980 [Verrucomicrobiota bacterium]|nr:MAG: hypothetical protein LW808_000980 [Verrucomicrobiota bacterium]
MKNHITKLLSVLLLGGSISTALAVRQGPPVRATHEHVYGLRNFLRTLHQQDGVSGELFHFVNERTGNINLTGVSSTDLDILVAFFVLLHPECIGELTSSLERYGERTQTWVEPGIVHLWSLKEQIEDGNFTAAEIRDAVRRNFLTVQEAQDLFNMWLSA